MAKKVEKLKKLYAKNGGDPADVAHIHTTGDMIDALAELEIGGGGGNDFVVTYMPGGTFTCDKTFAEIRAAFDAGKNIKANVGGVSFLKLDQVEGTSLHFSYITNGASNIIINAILHNNADVITYTSKTIS